MTQPLSEASRGVRRFTQRVRTRAWAWSLTGAAALGVGAAALCLGLGGWLVGAAPSSWECAAFWALTAAAAVWAARLPVRPALRLRGAHVAYVLREQDSQLAHDTRSAIELAAVPDGSHELVDALTFSVHERLGQLDLGRLTRPRTHEIQLVALILLAGCGLLWISTTTDRGQAGLFALTHPDWLAKDVREGVWVRALEVEVSPPLHIDAVARRYVDPEALQVHAGSRVEVRVGSSMKLARATLQVGALTLPLQRDDSGDWTGAWVAEEQGPIRLNGWTEGWLTDAKPRTLQVVADEAPRVVLSHPTQDQRVAATQRVTLKFDASDDHGLAGVDLMVRGPGAQEHRQRVAAPASGERRRTLGGEMTLRASDFQARPGDTLSLWLEASDANRHVGPLVGHSEIRTLTVTGETSEHGVTVTALTEAREQALELLADRLEREVPEPGAEARERHASLTTKTQVWLGTLSDLANNVDEDTAGLLRGMERRVRNGLSEESALQRGRGAALAKRRQADDEAVKGLEGDVLWLEDLLSRARVRDAEAVLSQIHAAEQRMRQLLQELARAPDEASRRALLAEVARMRAQMQELMTKLQDVRGTVPAEFVNREAMNTQPQRDALSKLEDAITKGGIEEAQGALDELAQQLAQLEQGLGETGVALEAARFSPRSEATSRTLQQLSQLEETQRALSEETNEIGRQAAARSGTSAGAEAQAQKLGREARGLADKLDSLGGDQMSGPMAESRATAAQRLRDVSDSLENGDYFEGESMARHAAAEMDGVSRELAMDARMFPGRDGEVLDTAREAEALRERAEALADKVSQAAPDMDRLLDEDDRREVRQHAPAQRELAHDVRQAREQLEQSQGDDGLSAGAAHGLSDAEEAMRQASQALKRGQLSDAQAHQREAMERMAQLRQDLQRQARAGSREGEGERPGSGEGDSDERVAIPQDADANQRSALRRRVLDARRAPVPPGYEKSVERFYEELLR